MAKEKYYLVNCTCGNQVRIPLKPGVTGGTGWCGMCGKKVVADANSLLVTKA